MVANCATTFLECRQLERSETVFEPVLTGLGFEPELEFLAKVVVGDANV
ncbi:MAG: hypothetical protein RLP02_13045 [Coleofasciculus sp. C2-GNP5-27]